MKDARRPAFIYQTVAAIRVILASFTGRELTTALGVYLAMTFEANEQRDRTSFVAPRGKIAELSGASKPTVDRYCERFVELGLVAIERGVGRGKGNTWTLLDPPEKGQAALPISKSEEESSLTLSDEKGSSGLPVSSCKGSKKEQQKNSPDPLTDEFESWLAHHLAITGMQPPGLGTQGRAYIEGLYRARRGEGLSVEQLELAIEGAFGNDFRRENLHYDHESVLRPKKVHKLAEWGRLGRQRPSGPPKHFENERDPERFEGAF